MGVKLAFATHRELRHRDVRCYDEVGEVAFHAIHAVYGGQSAEPQVWHASAPDWNGVLVMPRQNLITAIANRINMGAKQIIIGDNVLYLDNLGNTWINDRYMAPHEYLPMFIVE